MELAELKRFLRIDSDYLDAVLTDYQQAAEVYLQNAGVRKDYNNALYKVVITIFVGLMVENPSLSTAGATAIETNALTLTALIAQLRDSQGDAV